MISDWSFACPTWKLAIKTGEFLIFPKVWPGTFSSVLIPNIGYWEVIRAKAERSGTNEKPVDIPIQTQPQRKSLENIIMFSESCHEINDLKTWKRPSDEPVEVREIVIEKPLKKQWSHNLCNCSGSCNDCCRAFCCPVLRWIILSQYESYFMEIQFGFIGRKDWK